MKNRTWVITDTHFFHDKMIELCGRPEDFHNRIIVNWLAMVEPTDTIIHLGDVSWRSDTVVDKLPGRKILVRGNHDKQSNSWYMQHGFDFSCDSFSMKYGGFDILFTHEPKIFHEHDLNVYGHLHNLAKVTSVCEGYKLSIEETRYTPLLLDKIISDIRLTHKEL